MAEAVRPAKAHRAKKKKGRTKAESSTNFSSSITEELSRKELIKPAEDVSSIKEQVDTETDQSNEVEKSVPGSSLDAKDNEGVDSIQANQEDNSASITDSAIAENDGISSDQPDPQCDSQVEDKVEESDVKTDGEVDPLSCEEAKIEHTANECEEHSEDASREEVSREKANEDQCVRSIYESGEGSCEEVDKKCAVNQDNVTEENYDSSLNNQIDSVDDSDQMPMVAENSDVEMKNDDVKIETDDVEMKEDGAEMKTDLKSSSRFATEISEFDDIKVSISEDSTSGKNPIEKDKNDLEIIFANVVQTQETINERNEPAALKEKFMKPESERSHYLVENTSATNSTLEYLATRIVPNVPALTVQHENLAPFTEEQLRKFYFNTELEQVPLFIDQFLQNTIKETHEFYELLNTYHRCRVTLVQVQDQIKTNKSSIASTIEGIWRAKLCEYKAEGNCRDHVQVNKIIGYTQMEFSTYKAADLARQLTDFRNLLHEDHQLKSYNSQMARIRIEAYLFELFNNSRLLRKIKPDHPITGVLPRNMNRDDVRSLCQLQDCISVLFAFKRLSNVEEVFNNDLKTWLGTLVSALQRAGALPDHFFILNHILRCPPSTIPPISDFIQFPNFESLGVDSIWNSPLVHHFVVMLATFALPIKERVSFLSKYKQTIKPTMERAMSWTFVDENREEDENPEDSWYLLLESDLVSIFEQFPFENLFYFLLQMKDACGDVQYMPHKSTSNDILRLLAFASCLVKLLGQMFDTYNILRYRQFVKRISRTIRWIVQVVSDHWCAYRSWRIELCGDSEKDIPTFMTVSTQFSLERLQMEFDQFFSKATEQILQSQSVGALQFLASMPYDAISTNAAWSLLNRLAHVHKEGQSDKDGLLTIAAIIPSMNAPAEAVYLLTSLSNMAMSRNNDDKEFIEIVVKNILEIAYINDATKDICSRSSRDLLATVSAKHPFIMSYLLWRLGDLIDKINENCLYILKGLPFDLWRPEVRDMEKLRSWFLEYALGSLQHQMAKAVISKMNFDLCQDTNQLFLPQNYHFAIAVMIVEVYGTCMPEGPGGLKSLEYNNDGFITQVGKFAYKSINKILNAQVLDEFDRWSWDTMLSLKLHVYDMPFVNRDEDNGDLLLTFDDSNTEEIVDGSWFSRALATFAKVDSTNLELEHAPELLNVQRAVRTQGALACYVALAMTKLGHSPDLFNSQGVKFLSTILEAGWIDAALWIISNVTPSFIKCAHLLHAKSPFLWIIDTLVHMDANKAGYTEKIWQYPEPGFYSQKLASIIVNHAIRMSKQSNELVDGIISLWLKILSQLSNWYRDLSVQFLLDHMCKIAYFLQGKMDHIVDLLQEQFKLLVQQQASRGFISSMVSWMSSAAPVTLLEINKQPDYSYYAFAVLQMEMSLEQQSGLWKNLILEMTVKQNASASAAYKKVTSNAKFSYLPPLQSLSIYRWANQGLVTNPDHPLLPVIWQKFFTLFLQKPKPELGMPHRVGVGYRFFNKTEYTAMAKNIRTHLNSIASYHQDKSVPKEENEQGDSNDASNLKSHIHDQTMHATLASLYQAMALWIEEPRLHDASLYLDALPEVYKPMHLEKIFQGDEELWLQFIDMETISKEIESFSSLWAISVNKSLKTRSRIKSTEDAQVRPTASQQIIRRLNRETKPKPPPLVSYTESPIPEVSLQLLLSRPRFIQEIDQDLERFVIFAKKSAICFAENVALDEEYKELVLDLYEHLVRQYIVEIPCNGRRGKRGMCTGPARVVVRYEEGCLRERIARCLEDNRSAWSMNTSNAAKELPKDLSTGAVYVEKVIDTLMKSLPYANPSQKNDLIRSGITLFYLLAELINDNVKRCHSAIQFFSSTTDILGKEFIADNEEEQPRLLKTILSEEASVSFLATHFNPAVQYRNFLQLYGLITDSDAVSRLTTCFVLLTKFDIRAWLAAQPPLSERLYIIRAIISSLQKFGATPSQEAGMVFDLYRRHFLLVLNDRFPQLYHEALHLLATGSDMGTLPPCIWGDFLICVGCQVNDHLIATSIEHSKLNVSDVTDTLNWLASFFAEISKKRYYLTSRLYEEWHPYTPYLKLFMAHLFGLLTEPCLTDGFESNLLKERYISNAWNLMFAVYRHWIVPHKPDTSWPSLHIENATSLIQSFTECARMMVECSIYGNSFSIGMNMVWAFYCAEIASCVTDEASLRVYHEAIAALPWRYLCPSVVDLQRMLEMQLDNPIAFCFLGSILYSVKWNLVIEQYNERQDTNRIYDIHVAILRILVMLAVTEQFIDNRRSQFEELCSTASRLSWQHLNDDIVDSICGWFAENCDAVKVLDDKIFESTVMNLFKAVCCYLRSIPVTSTESASNKRNSYTKMMVKLITRASEQSTNYKPKNDVDTLLRDTEVLSIGSREELSLLISTVLTLLNSIPEGPFLKHIENQLQSFLSETNSEALLLCTLSAGCRVLASLDQLVSLCECSIEAFLSRQPDSSIRNSWTKVLEAIIIPELNQEEFTRKALTKQCLLTLFAFNLHRISICATLDEERTILIENFRWCLETPPSPVCPEKFLLIWWQILNGIQRQIDENHDKMHQPILVKYILLFAHYCQQISEDKSYTGILGAIGIGKKSLFSAQFRLAARSLHAFFTAQMPGNGSILRCVPDAPGHVCQKKGLKPTETPTNEAKEALQGLINLQKNKAYSSLKDELHWIIQFISDPKTCLTHGPKLLTYICSQMFFKFNYIYITCQP